MCLFMKERLSDARLESGETRGFEYEIVHNEMAYRCGYIKVLPGHPWFGVHYDSIEADVHGGLTYSDYGVACAGEHDEKAEWWVGFDCAHGGDAPDPTLVHKTQDPEGTQRYIDIITGVHEETNARFQAMAAASARFFRDTIKDTPYVREQCAQLAQQAHDAALTTWAAEGR